jgi:hypothetical protein
MTRSCLLQPRASSGVANVSAALAGSAAPSGTRSRYGTITAAAASAVRRYQSRIRAMAASTACSSSWA